MKSLHRLTPDDVLVAFARGPLSTSQLSSRFNISLHAAQCHVRKLLKCGQIVAEVGPDRRYRVIDQPARQGHVS